jgi:hypothetical protein
MASGSRDPKSHYALQQSHRTKNFLIILVMVGVVYMFIPAPKRDYYRETAPVRDTIVPAKQVLEKNSTFHADKKAHHNF